MQRLVLLLVSIFSVTACTKGLSEFSTSMDFDEFAVVVEHLRASEAPLSEEISANIAEFKGSTALGKGRTFQLKSAPGYMTLEREDERAFTVAMFTGPDVRKKIEAAYNSAGKELGIQLRVPADRPRLASLGSSGGGTRALAVTGNAE